MTRSVGTGSELFGSVAAQRAALLARAVSPIELVEAAIRRIEGDEDRLSAWVEVDAEGAIAAARNADLDAPLGGIPFGAKDVIDVRGLPTRYGVNLDIAPAAFDAWCVAAIRRAGAIPLGKLETTAFASSDPASTRNPWNLARTPGGSSAGSGAAVGAHQIPFALGTQTGGSTLRPAAYNGVVGFKPTFGAIPTPGVSMFAPTFDHVGIICRDAVDAAALFGVFDPSVLGEIPPPRAPQIFAALDFRSDVSGPEVRATLDAALVRLASAGAVVETGSLPAEIEEVDGCWTTIVAHEANAALSSVVPGSAAGPLIRAIVERGGTIDAGTYRAARLLRDRIRRSIGDVLARVDAVALPTAGPVPDPTTTGNAVFLRPWSLAGVPAISLPAGFDADGMPIGLQLVAKRDADAALLALARWAETAIALENPGPRARLDR